MNGITEKEIKELRDLVDPKVKEVQSKQKESFKCKCGNEAQKGFVSFREGKFVAVGVCVDCREKVNKVLFPLDILFKEVKKRNEERSKQRQKKFKEAKEDWLQIEKGEKSMQPAEKGKCEFPGCKNAVNGLAVVVAKGNAEVCSICAYHGVALMDLKREKKCERFVYFRGKDAEERVNKHLFWLKKKQEEENPLKHKPFLTAINGGKQSEE